MAPLAKTWAAQVRAPFLLLPVLLVSIGGAAAWRDGAWHAGRFFLTLLGAVLAHVAVNVFNELSDHRSGIDHHTRRTPFSGGSGTLQSGALRFPTVRVAAWTVLAVALAIGLFLTWQSGVLLLAFIIPGGLAAVFYTSHLSRWAIGELAAGVCLGSSVVLGTYFAQTSDLSGPVVALSVPPGVLTALLLLLNEFPDREADRAGGRRHLVILLGTRGAAVVYTALLALMYAFIATSAALGWLPRSALLALLTLPLAFKAALTALRYGHVFEKMVPALGANVATVLGTDLLLAVAVMVGA